MRTVHGMILNSHRTENIPLPTWTQVNKLQTPGTALDGVFLLNTGFVKLDNRPMTLNNNGAVGTHVISDTTDGNILMLFLTLQEACDNVEATWLNPLPYVASARFSNVRIV